MKILTKNDVSIAAKCLTQGHAIIIPTSRWYMICCDAEDMQTREAIFTAKKRPKSKKLLFAIPDVLYTKAYFKMSPAAEALTKNLWPGDLFILMPWATKALEQKFSSAQDGVALANCPDRFFGRLLNYYGRPIVSAAASLSSDAPEGKTWPAITLPEVKDFVLRSGLKVGAIVDGGICPVFNHSTVVDCVKEPKIVREGTVHKVAINVTLKSIGMKV